MAKFALVEKFIAEITPAMSPATIPNARIWTNSLETWRESTGTEYGDPKLCRSFAYALIERGLASATAKAALGWARKYLRWLKENGIAVAEQHTVALPRAHQKLGYVPEAEDVERLIAHCMKVKQPYGTLIAILPLTGFRDSEAIKLKTSDWRNNTPDGRVIWHVVEPKNGKDREVPMLSSGGPILARYLTVHRPKLGVESEYLFPRQNGKLLRRSQVEWHMRQIRVALGLPDLSCHALRRFFATFLMNRGMDSATVAKIIGHSDMNTFARYYQPTGRTLARQMAEIERGDSDGARRAAGH